jgi:glycine cleavage system aminomethyltransferase T
MNRKLVGLLLGESVPSPRAELRSGDRKVGFVTTAVRSPALRQQVALGYVHRDFLEPGTQLTLADGGAPVTVSGLPLVSN